MKHILSVDLESFVHRQFDVNKRSARDNGYTLRVAEFILGLFEKYHTRATFFVTGEIYEWYPKLIREIYKQGHELGYHTHRHVLLTDGNILKKELQLSRDFLKEYRPRIFRAPRMYMRKEYLNILENYGFLHDSSTYGTFSQKRLYGKIQEIPVSLFPYFPLRKSILLPGQLTAKLFLKGIPYGSGLAISILQRRIQLFIDYAESRNEPAVLFFHPWQLFSYDDDSIALTLANLPRFIYRRSIKDDLIYLLSRNEFGSFRDVCYYQKNEK